MNDLVTVIIPVYNGERYIADAIESVLAQTYSPHEIIVIDDGSTDASADVARRYENVVCVTQPNGGISVARNRGIELARGSFIAFLDADDQWLPHKTALQMQFLNEHPNIDMVFGGVQEFISPELSPEIASTIHCEPEPRPGVVPSAAFLRRSALERIGPFESRWSVGEFANWILRANEVRVVHTILPDLVVRRRLHMTNNGIRNRQQFNDYVRMLKASLDRRRASASANSDDSPQ